MAGDNANWWRTGIIYQIYPRSFQDSNHDGVGDLEGIIHRLPYLTELGVDAIWLSPIFTSPMADFGYDIANYKDVDPLFGNMADLDNLIAAAHRRQLKLILDFVPNHTSDQHPWFVESKTSRDNPKRDWFIWRPPAPDGGPPNNWLSEFGGTAWQFDSKTNQYYYHTFLATQPDLNWRNPEVCSAMHDVMRFWLKRGIDGFRVDAVWYLIKDHQFRDNPSNPEFRPGGLKNVPGIGVGRDGCRTPMQWDATESAGFSDADPWLPMADSYRDQNVDRFRKDKGSLYWLYRSLIDIRRKHVALAVGSYKPLKASGDLLLFCRELREERIVIALNMGAEPLAASFADKRILGRVLLSSYGDREGEEVRCEIDLRGNEGLLIKLGHDQHGSVRQGDVRVSG